jgi:hypothetical protein
MKPRTIPAMACNIAVICEQEDLHPMCNAMQSGDLEYDAKVATDICERLERGECWAWCYIVVQASFGPFTGRAGLGACSYANEADFRGCEYFETLKADAVENLNKNIQSVWHNLQPLMID